MKIQRIAVIIISLFTASLAHAQYYWAGPPGMGPYFRAGIGPTIFQDSELKGFAVDGISQPTAPVSYDVGVALDGAIGFAFNRYVGLDFNTGYIWGRFNNVPGYDVHDSTMANVPFLGNVTLSLPIPHTNIVPYIGGGAGGAVSIFDARNFSNIASGAFADGSASDTVFACQAFAGVRFLLAPDISLGIGYQFFATGNPTFSGSDVTAEFRGVRSHSILFTLRANF